jgi:hypothetical protein
LQIADSTSLQWAAGDFTVYTVHRHTTQLPGYAIVYAKWTDAFPYPGFFLWANYPYSAPGSAGPQTASYVTRLDYNTEVYGDASATYNDGMMRVVGSRLNGKMLELHVEGHLVSENDASVADPTGFNAANIPAYIGGRPGGGQDLTGDIAEIIAVKGSLTDAELANLEKYLAQKYGL